MYRVQWRVTEQLHTHMVCCIQLPLYIMHSTLPCCHPACSSLGEPSNWQHTRGDDCSDPRNRIEAHNGGCLPTDPWFWWLLTRWSLVSWPLTHIQILLQRHYGNRYWLILTSSLAQLRSLQWFSCSLNASHALQHKSVFSRVISFG